ncbi:membrane protein [Actinoplanes philippinensis]|uniref:Inner membrane transporter RhtA n=1 Tax=Actinoplanes philippinensis TaxID=35752 RepID=A0A1I2G622_9ACTN|nr:EamA family transporter [Actinoplanes philippinensis]GIE76653.1 membrane protein [Actinoplanes philippinensis]SFF13085.1 inner membrane transporter RhtA [Actinoplanes philippinensis]
MNLAGTGLVLGAALSVQFGSAVATLLFPRAGAAGIVALRLALAAIVLLAVCRPRLRGLRRGDWLVAAGFGVAMAGMNGLFYQAIDRIPLGPAVTLEVLGPLTLAVVTARRRSGWLWAGLALTGVLLLGYQGFDSLTAAGTAFALGAGAMWAAYIVFSARAGRRFPKADGLALALAAGALLTLPFGIADAGAALLNPATLALGAVVALLSSVLPYTMELLALRRLPTSTFAVLMSLGPAIAALAGFLILDQRLSPPELLAVALVVAASAGAVRTPPPPVTASSAPPPVTAATRFR